MKNENISFKVDMSVTELYRFIMYHAYHKLSGIVGIVMASVSLVILLLQYANLQEQTRAVLILIFVWFVILDPIILRSRARGQLKRNKVYKDSLCYEISQEGICISQGEQTQTIKWEQFCKIVETKTQFLFYNTPMNALIFPKASIGMENCQQFEELIKKSTQGTRVQLKGKLK